MRVFKDIEKLPTFKNAIITIGTFDGVHMGHQKLLQRINELAKKHHGESILITFHPHPRFVLQPENNTLKLLNTIDEKIRLLQYYNIDNVVIYPFSKAFSQLSALAYIKDFLVGNFNPHTIVIGYDHHFGKNRSGNIDLLEKYKETFNYNVEQISKETIADIGISSTKIRHALAEGNVTIAKELLGHAYSIEGFVIKGNQLGRKIGFPTANLKLTEIYKLIPKNGGYAVRVYLNEKSYIGMLNIGIRPTVAGTDKTIEVHLFNFEQEIYGETVRIELYKYLRDEIKFNSIEDLKAQLSMDKKATITYFESLTSS